MSWTNSAYVIGWICWGIGWYFGSTYISYYDFKVIIEWLPWLFGALGGIWFIYGMFNNDREMLHGLTTSQNSYRKTELQKMTEKYTNTERELTVLRMKMRSLGVNAVILDEIDKSAKERGNV